MKQVVKQLRSVFSFLVVTFAMVLCIWVIAWFVRGDVKDKPMELDPVLAAKFEEQRNPQFDPNNTPTLHLPIDVTPRGESPILKKLVDEGELPPLAERVPEKPIVLDTIDGIGEYGGTWLRLAIAPDDVGIITYRLSGAFLARWSPLGYPIEPHIAESITPSNEDRVWTIKLREGIRWSDGEPYTADDIMYWWDNEVNNTYVSSNPPSWMINAGKVGRVEQIDKYTVRVEFDEPYTNFMEVLALRMEMTDNPRHYLQQYHPDPAIGNNELIEEMMRKHKLPSRLALYWFIKNWINPEYPRLWPWLFRTYTSNAPFVFVRNPYYYVFDKEGNQLPYIDRIQFDVLDSKMLALRAADGSVSMQGRHIRFSDYTELMTQSEANGYRVLHWYPATRSTFAINPNLNRRVDPNDPSTKWKAKLLSDKRFRQALSLAINRESIIQAEQAGVGEPSQVAPGQQSKFDYPALTNAFTEYDPPRADALLDELGLDKRDDEGMRTFPDGTRMSFYLDFCSFTGAGPGQFIVDDWAEVGVRVTARERARSLFYTEKDSCDFDFNVWTGESDMVPMIAPRYYIPTDTEAFYAVGWGRWYQNGGFYGSQQSKTIRGSIPVPKSSPMYEAISSYEKAIHTSDPKEQKKYIERMLQIAADNTWTINIATSPPIPFVVDKRMRNVPEIGLYGYIFATPSNTGIETYYFENATNTPGATAQVEEAIKHVTPRPAADGSDDTNVIGKVVKLLLFGIFVLFLLLIGWKHPFVWRRLMIMVPTLLVISVVTFTIIQLPPGDYLTTRIMLLQESGDQANLQAIEDLKDVFHYEEPSWKLYLRWMGFYWFKTYEPADQGLLQGNLGRSMETMSPINEVVGDRLLLTMAISIGTILMTWAIALPIGIYSAVRQYSISDYILTVLGFLGMCTPAFLLALVLMVYSDQKGLFSPEFAAQPEWDWPKFIDLLKHIWIPIVVLGIGGTAGMIRIMRANLLDELQKPYVTTAKAKGVRPMKLLIKYPVRLALNPFVSGIGYLFPQIVSGGAIVAMVLALPTVGPLLLSALFTEDMYLAGSMLMVLSLLGVFGTLVSDLLAAVARSAYPFPRGHAMTVIQPPPEEAIKPDPVDIEAELMSGKQGQLRVHEPVAVDPPQVLDAPAGGVERAASDIDVRGCGVRRVYRAAGAALARPGFSVLPAAARALQL